MNTIKQHVYIVLEYDHKDRSRVIGVYVSDLAAKRKAARSYVQTGSSIHIIKKSVQGTERLVSGSNLIIERQVGDQ